MQIHLTFLKLLLMPFLRKYMKMPGKSFTGQFSPLNAQEAEIKERLDWYVRSLAVDIGERSIARYDKLCDAARYIENTLWGLGYDVAAQDFVVDNVPLKNLEVELRGRSRPQEIIVIGAHYDTVPGTPGADDNASGVAALLELARLLRELPLERTVRLVAFANKEVSHEHGHKMGSYAYAQRSRQRGDKIVGMISLEMLGFFSDEEGSQKYPFPFSLFYPSKGNFIAFVGNHDSRNWVHRSIKAFRKHARFPSEGGALPSRFSDISRSDHSSFWSFGFPGLMMTDTSNFRFTRYHTEDDTPDKVDTDKMCRIVSGLVPTIVELASSHS